MQAGDTQEQGAVRHGGKQSRGSEGRLELNRWVFGRDVFVERSM